MMKRCLAFPFIVFAFLTTFIFVGCAAKETPPAPAITEAPSTQEPEVMPEPPEAAEVEATQEAPEAPLAQEVETPPDAVEAVPAQETETPSAPTEEAVTEAEAEITPESPPVTEVEEERPLVEIPSGSVLNLIPEQTFGLIYCPSLLELDNRLSLLATDLLPTTEPPELLAQILADTFGAGFENLTELEEIGLNLNQDFAIFITSLGPERWRLSATVHVTEPEAIMQVIETEAEGSVPTEYNGVKYWNAAEGSGSFAILEDTLVFSQQPEMCENVIDVYNGTRQSIAANPDYSLFLTDILEGTDQLAIHFDFETIAPTLSALLQKELESMRDSIESDPATMAIAPLFEKLFSTGIWLVEQLDALSVTLQVEGTDVQVAPFLTFQKDSSIQRTLGELPSELTLLGGLPERAILNGAFQMNPKVLLEVNTLGLKLFADDTPQQQETLEALIQKMMGFYQALKENMSFSLDFHDSLMPDTLTIYELQDEQKAKAYMEEMFLDQLHLSMQLMKGVLASTPGAVAMYKDAQPGMPEAYNGVEIQSYVFPNFGTALAEMPPEAARLMPTEWNCYYAFHEGQLLLAMGSSSQHLKTALDRQAGRGTNIERNPSYQRLAEKLETKNNVFLAFSPIIMLKSMLPILAESDPNNAAAMQMLSGMFMNLPDSYSIGFSAKARDGGIGAKLLLTLGDFKQLIQMVAMMQGTGQMQ